MTFTNSQLEIYRKVWDKETTAKLKETVEHFESEIERAKVKVNILNDIIYTRENK